MCENSDGKENNVKKSVKTNTTMYGKTRSFSVGSSGMSKSDINKIIGIYDKNAEKINRQINIEQTNSSGKTDLPGALDKFDSHYSVENVSESKECNLFADYTDVFKPKKSAIRTPPAKTEKDKNIDASNKRPRSENTPETEKNTKKQREEVYSEKNDNSNNLESPCFEKQKNNEPSSEKSTESVILQFFSALGNIQKLSENEVIDTKNQCLLMSAINTLSKSFTLLVYKNGETEKENMTLKFKLNANHQDIPIKKISVRQPNLQAEQKTYASITQKHTENQPMKTPVEEEQWTTPKSVKKHETIVRVENISDPKEAMKTFKQKINIKDIGEGFKSIKPTKDGAIIVESHNKNQQEKLRNVIRNADMLKYKENETLDPMFMITGIEKGFSDTEFLEELERLNIEIVEELQTNISNKIKIITKKPCRNQNKENWILQAPPKITKWFLKKGTVYFDLVTVYVQEYFNLALCFKCAGFGHIAKYCKEKECCNRCGEPHLAKNCITEKLKCPNCQKLKLLDIEHSARDLKCPVYKRRLERYKNNINYEDNFL